MNLETWHVLVALAVVALVFWIAVGVFDVEPGSVVVSVVAIATGLYIGRKLSDRMDSAD